MALSAFDDKGKQPQDRELSKVLASASDLWNSLVDHLAEEYLPLDEQWGFSGKQWGWSLRLKQKKRTILYMTPSDGFFYVGFALGEKAVRAAQLGNMPKRIMGVIENASKYAEGRGVRLEVRKKADLQSIRKLAAIKMST